MIKNLSRSEKDALKVGIYAGSAFGTFVIYKMFGLDKLLVQEDISNAKVKTLKEIFAELKAEINARCIFYDTQVSIIDEKSQAQEDVAERAKLYYFGYPVDFKEPEPDITTNDQPTSQDVSFWDAVQRAAEIAAKEAEGKSTPDNVIARLIKEAIDQNNTALPQKIPNAEFKRFMETEYNKYKSQIVISYNSGIKVRLPHQPFISCLPLIVDLFNKRGYSKHINEQATLYRLISFQQTMLREIPPRAADGTDTSGPVIINGINIETGKTVVEEPPPPNAVVIPTTGPHAGKIIPIGETAIM